MQYVLAIREGDQELWKVSQSGTLLFASDLAQSLLAVGCAKGCRIHCFLRRVAQIRAGSR